MNSLLPRVRESVTVGREWGLTANEYEFLYGVIKNSKIDCNSENMLKVIELYTSSG